MSRYISVYVKTCDLCNQTKLQHRQPSRELHPTETPEEQWQVISVDFIIELPEFHGYDTDNLYTTQTPDYTKDKYNAKIKVKGSLLRSHQQPT
jgi:hypothetical protein